MFTETRETKLLQSQNIPNVVLSTFLKAYANEKLYTYTIKKNIVFLCENISTQHVLTVSTL